jgi:hypothetical protein
VRRITHTRGCNSNCYIIDLVIAESDSKSGLIARRLKSRFLFGCASADTKDFYSVSSVRVLCENSVKLPGQIRRRPKPRSQLVSVF